MSKGILILGGGGHASVLADILMNNGENIVGVINPKSAPISNVFDGLKIYHDDEEIYKFHRQEIAIVNGVGSLPGNSRRVDIYHKYSSLGYEFFSVLSTHAYISKYAVLGRGVQVMPGAIIQTGAVIGDNSIVNTASVVEHDCIIGNNNHIAPGAVLSGGVHTGSNVHIGTNATVIQNIKIGHMSIIGAGAVVNKDVNENNIVYPARVHKRGLSE